MMRDVKLSPEDRQTYKSWLRIMMGLVSPFGILFVVFLAYSIAGKTRNDLRPAANAPPQQEHGALIIP